MEFIAAYGVLFDKLVLAKAVLCGTINASWLLKSDRPIDSLKLLISLVWSEVELINRPCITEVFIRLPPAPFIMPHLGLN